MPPANAQCCRYAIRVTCRVSKQKKAIDLPAQERLLPEKLRLHLTGFEIKGYSSRVSYFHCKVNTKN